MRIKVGIILVLIECSMCQVTDDFQILSSVDALNDVQVNLSFSPQKPVAFEGEETSGFVYVDPICLDDRLWKQQVTKIVGGSMGDASRWPYLVSLQSKNSLQEYRHFCAGVMVAQNILVTTAHCIRGYKDSESELSGILNKDIYAALMPQCRHQEGVGRRKVSNFLVHPQYSPQDINYDIALLWLDQIPQNQQNFHQWDIYANYRGSLQVSKDGLFSAMGWGGTGYPDSLSLLFNSRMIPLQYATMQIIPKPSCDQEILRAGIGGNVKVVEETMICAKSFMGEDTCDGDSGGPLVMPDVLGDPSMDIIIGLTSWGPDTICGGDLVLPGVYTKLSNFVGWIDSSIIQLTNMMTKTSQEYYTLNSAGEFESSLAPITTPLINISLHTKFELPTPFPENQSTIPQNLQNYEVKSDQLMLSDQLSISATDQLAVYIQQPEADPPSLLCQVRSILQNTSAPNCD